MYARTTHGNRVALATLGLLLVLAGAAAVLVNRSTFGARATNTRIYPAAVQAWVSGHHWVYWGVAVMALVVVLAALRWLLVQLRTDRLPRIAVDSDLPDVEDEPGGATVRHPADAESEAGRTSLSAGALTSAVVTEVRAIAGVRQARAALSGAGDAPQLWLEVTVEQDADTGAIRAALVDPVLADVRRALEKPDMAAFLTLVVSGAKSRRQVA